jgi:hypothetical protein
MNYQDKKLTHLVQHFSMFMSRENIRVCSDDAAFDLLEGLPDRLCLFGGRSLGGGDGGSEDLVGIPDPKTNDSRRWLGESGRSG